MSAVLDSTPMLLARHLDQLEAEEAHAEALEERARVLYFDWLRALSRDGRLPDPAMHSELDEALFIEGPDSIQCAPLLRLVGDLNTVDSLNTEGRARVAAKIGEYVATIVERQLDRLADVAAAREAS